MGTKVRVGQIWSYRGKGYRVVLGPCPNASVALPSFLMESVKEPFVQLEVIVIAKGVKAALDDGDWTLIEEPSGAMAGPQLGELADWETLKLLEPKTETMRMVIRLAVERASDVEGNVWMGRVELQGPPDVLDAIRAILDSGPPLFEMAKRVTSENFWKNFMF